MGKCSRYVTCQCADADAVPGKRHWNCTSAATGPTGTAMDDKNRVSGEQPTPSGPHAVSPVHTWAIMSDFRLDMNDIAFIIPSCGPFHTERRYGTGTINHTE